jgi:hypothetical protein
MGVWQGIAMDSLKFYLGWSCPNFLRPASGPPAAVFYPFGHPTAHAVRLCPPPLLPPSTCRNKVESWMFFGWVTLVATVVIPSFPDAYEVVAAILRR